MCEERNEELIFKDMLEEVVENFGEGSQEGVKFAIKNAKKTWAVYR